VSGSATREALLDAAYRAAVDGNWARVRMSDVARSAGVSRQTLYNEFGSKDALAVAVAIRETARFLAGTEAAMASRRHRRPATAVAAAVAYTLAEAADNPLVKAALTDDAGTLLPFLTTRAEPLLAAARGGIERYLRENWPGLADADVHLAAETVVRLSVSYILLPSDDPDASAEAVASRLGRLADRLLASPHPHLVEPDPRRHK
jgi:AcrR family transcriptional regulator